MRALVAPLNADHPQRGMLDGFRKALGKDNVVEFDYLELQRRGLSVDDINDRFINQFVDGYWSNRHRGFDFAFLHLQTTDILTGAAIHQAKLASPRTIFTHWMGDWRPGVSEVLRGVCAACDLTLISNDGQRDLYKAAGARRISYCQIGLDWEEDVLGEPAFEPPFRVPDVVFCGNYYLGTFPSSSDRLKAILALQEAKIDVGVVGSGWPSSVNVVGTCSVKQQHHVYKRAKVALSISNINDCRLYYSDRQLISMASGAPVVCKHIPGLEEEFEHRQHCVFYDDEDYLIREVQMLLEDEEYRKAIGQMGRAKVMRCHSWETRIRELLPRIQLIQMDVA